MIWKGEATVLGATAKALRVVHENEEAWVPLSQIHDDSEIWKPSQVGETGVLAIPEWLAEKNGWL